MNWKCLKKLVLVIAFLVGCAAMGHARDCMYYHTIYLGDCAEGQEIIADENCIARCYWPVEYLDAEFPNHWENRDMPFEFEPTAIYFNGENFVWVNDTDWVTNPYFADMYDATAEYNPETKELTVIVTEGVTVTIKQQED